MPKPGTEGNRLGKNLINKLVITSRTKDFLDSALILALLSGVMYFGGLVYYQSFYSKLGATPELFKHDPSTYIAVSWEGVMWTILAFSIMAILRAGYHDIFSEKSRNSLLNFIKSTPAYIRACLWLAPVLTIIFSLQHMESKGAKAAQKRIDDKIEVEVSFTDTRSPRRFRYYSYANGKYILATIEEPLNSVLLPDTSVSSLTFIRTHSDYSNNTPATPPTLASPMPIKP